MYEVNRINNSLLFLLILKEILSFHEKYGSIIFINRYLLFLLD